LAVDMRFVACRRWQLWVRLGPADYRPAPLLRGRCSSVSGPIFGSGRIGAGVRFSGMDRLAIDGPFAETKELIAGYWLWKVASLREAIDWVKRCPNPHDEECEIEIRPVFEADDFGGALTPELRAQEERVMADAKRNAGA
jgi:hypothetical protein